MATKLYNLPQLVRTNSNPVTVTNTDSSQKRVRLYQGQDCAINFSAFNSTNKMLAIAGTTFVFKIWDSQTNTLLLTKTVSATKNDTVALRFSANELMSLPAGDYWYTCNLITGEDENLVLYIDTASEHRGTLELVSSASNSLIDSKTITVFNPTTNQLTGVTTYYSTAVNNLSKLNQHLTLHTYTAHLVGFTGTLIAEATLQDINTSTTGTDWFTVSTLTLADFTGATYDNFNGIYSQVRFKYTKTAGSLTKVVYRS